MVVKNKILISVDSSDLINGTFSNKDVIEIADGCFYNLHELVKVVLPKVKKIGNYCFSSNDKLTTVTLPALTTAGNDCFSSNDKLTTVTINKHELNTKNVDGFCFVIENEKTSQGIRIYSGYNLLSVKEKSPKIEYCYVAEKDKFYAHGTTVKKAIEDLNFKIVSEKLKTEPIKKDTVITINYYRLITGACEMGVKSWMVTNGVKDEKIKAVDLLPLLIKSNAYGLERFKKLLTF